MRLRHVPFAGSGVFPDGGMAIFDEDMRFPLTCYS
jgi:hypothetical protein